jgi:phage terminase small subunit
MTKTKELTPKQEAFAHAVASGMTHSDAYRATFKVGANTKTETVNQASSRLMANSNITARVAELRKPVAERAMMTLESHLKRLSDLSDSAEAAGQYSAAIAAEIARGKASGVMVDKVELSGPNGGDIPAKLVIEYVRPNPAT